MATKILIAVDIEGIAGVWRPEQTQAGQADHEPARRWMTDEASAPSAAPSPAAPTR